MKKEIVALHNANAELKSQMQQIKSNAPKNQGIPEQYRKMLEGMERESAGKKAVIRGWDPNTDKATRSTEIVKLMNAIDDKFKSYIDDGRIKLSNVEVKKDGEKVFTNLSFVDFPSNTLRDRFLEGMAGKTVTVATKTLKFSKGMTKTAMARNKPLYSALDTIEKEVSDFSKTNPKIMWNERALRYNGTNVWVQNEDDNGFKWHGQFAHHNSDMSDEE